MTIKSYQILLRILDFEWLKKLAKTAQFHTVSTCQACSCKLGCHTKVSFGEVSATTSGTGAFIFKAMHCQTGEPSAIISIPNCTGSEATAKAPVGNLLQRAFLHFTNPSGIHPFLVPPPKKQKCCPKPLGCPTNRYIGGNQSYKRNLDLR